MKQTALIGLKNEVVFDYIFLDPPFDFQKLEPGFKIYR